MEERGYIHKLHKAGVVRVTINILNNIIMYLNSALLTIFSVFLELLFLLKKMIMAYSCKAY